MSLSEGKEVEKCSRKFNAKCNLYFFLMVEELYGEFLSFYQFGGGGSMLMYTVMALTNTVHISDSVDLYIFDDIYDHSDIKYIFQVDTHVAIALVNGCSKCILLLILLLKHFCFYYSVLMQADMKGAMVWDGGDKSNSTIKVVLLKGKPHLCRFAIRDIATGEEISIKFGINCIIIIFWLTV